MAFFLSPFFFFFFFFFFSTSSLIHLGYAPPLLSLSCIPLSPNLNPIETLLNNLTSETPKSHYKTLRRGRYTGLMQCRPGLSPENCTLCAEEARIMILNRCRHTYGVSAWFDGCYVQISSDHVYTKISNHSCSGRTLQDPAQFVPALGALLLKLRANANIPTRRGFSHGEIGYGNSNGSESKIYGLVECARLLSPRECDSCIAGAIGELLSYCGGENGGVLVHGMCLVRFDSGEFYFKDAGCEGGGVKVRGDYFSVGEGENGGSKKKIVMMYWSGGVGCLALVGLMAWLLRRAVLNRGKVGISDFDQTVGKM